MSFKKILQSLDMHRLGVGIIQINREVQQFWGSV